MGADCANTSELLLTGWVEEFGWPIEGYETMGAWLLYGLCQDTGRAGISWQEVGQGTELEAKLTTNTNLVRLRPGEDGFQGVEMAISVVMGTARVSTKGLGPDGCCCSTVFLPVNGLAAGWALWDLFLLLEEPFLHVVVICLIEAHNLQNWGRDS
jgi:hypothetical protein